MALLDSWRFSFARLQNEEYVWWYFTITFATFPFANNAQHRLLYYLAIPFLLVHLSRHLARPLAREPLLRDPLLLLAFAFLAWSFISLAWSETATAESVFRGLKTGPLIGLFLLALAVHCRRDPGEWERLLRVYVLATLAAGLLLLLLNAPEILRFEGNFRIEGFGQGRNPNDCGRIFSAALLLLLLAPRAVLPLKSLAPGFGALLRVAAAVLLGAVVFLSGSRGAALGLVASLLVLFPLERRFGALALLLLAAGLLAALALLEVPLPRLLLATDEGNGRLEIWSQALALWQEAPLLGKGIAANFAFTVPGLGSFSAVHNVYLGALVSLGLVGFLLFLALFAFSILRAARIGRRQRASLLGLLLFGAVGMAFAAQTYYVQLTPEWFWFWIPLAATAGLEYGRPRGRG